ncbi:MAG: glycosyltransferase family 39 protein [Oligoflexales bacterium]|nr:glycosyltransferase family 39 protein [Oligoflexales bacterium]
MYQKIMKYLPPLDHAFFGLLFVFSLGWAIHFFGYGWDSPIGTGSHGFRQTQTAISTYFLAQGGPWFAYETPVLGPPWSIPMEFPLYQWIVAVLNHTTGYPLGVSGRLVSVLMFLVSLIFLYQTLKQINTSVKTRLLIVSLMLVTPIYQFYSWAFMIESTALALCMVYCWASIHWLQSNRVKWAVFSLFFGVLAALVKITTFFGFNVLLSFFVLHKFFQENGKWKAKTILKYLSYGTVLAIIPLLCLSIWVGWTDFLKEQNPLSQGFITSQALKTWNFGTIDSKLDWSSWDRILNGHLATIVGKLSTILPFLIFGLFNKTRFLQILSCLFVWLLVPAVFTNLYVVHDYYAYANSIFLILSVGLSFSVLVEKKHWLPHVAAVLSCVYLVTHLTDVYQSGYKRGQLAFRGDLFEVNKAFSAPQNNFKKGALIIWGEDWSPEIAFSARRRVIMDRSDRPLNDQNFLRSIELAGGKEAIAGLVFCRRSGAFVSDRLHYFEMSDSKPFQVGACKYFMKKNIKSPISS